MYLVNKIVLAVARTILSTKYIFQAPIFPEFNIQPTYYLY